MENDEVPSQQKVVDSKVTLTAVGAHGLHAVPPLIDVNDGHSTHFLPSGEAFSKSHGKQVLPMGLGSEPAGQVPPHASKSGDGIVPGGHGRHGKMPWSPEN